MPSSYFVVRATVTDPERRAAFDTWYRNEHLPDAARSWGVKKAWRSLTDPPLHQATYEFPDEAALERAMKGEARRAASSFPANAASRKRGRGYGFRACACWRMPE